MSQISDAMERFRDRQVREEARARILTLLNDAISNLHLAAGEAGDADLHDDFDIVDYEDAVGHVEDVIYGLLGGAGIVMGPAEKPTPADEGAAAARAEAGRGACQGGRAHLRAGR